MRKMVVIDPEKLEWEPIKELPKGAWIKMLSHDEETGAFSALFKFDKGYNEPRHSHPSDHDILILEGKLVDLRTILGRRTPICSSTPVSIGRSWTWGRVICSQPQAGWYKT